MNDHPYSRPMPWLAETGESVARLPDIASHGHDLWWEGDLRVTRTAGRESGDQPPAAARIIAEQADPRIIMTRPFMDGMEYRFPVTHQPDGSRRLTIAAANRTVTYACTELPCGCWQGFRQDDDHG